MNERVEEFVVEGLGPGLAGEHCAEVRAVLAHDLLETDHGGALGCRSHELGCGREPDDVRCRGGLASAGSTRCEAPAPGSAERPSPTPPPSVPDCRRSE